MSSRQDDDQDGRGSSSDHGPGWKLLLRLAGAALTLQLLYFAIIFFTVEKWETRGQFGDLFGFMNALFAGVGLLYVAITIRQQSHQIAQQSESLAQQCELIQLQREDLNKNLEIQASMLELAREQAKQAQAQGGIAERNLELQQALIDSAREQTIAMQAQGEVARRQLREYEEQRLVNIERRLGEGLLDAGRGARAAYLEFKRQVERYFEAHAEIARLETVAEQARREGVEAGLGGQSQEAHRARRTAKQAAREALGFFETHLLNKPSFPDEGRAGHVRPSDSSAKRFVDGLKREFRGAWQRLAQAKKVAAEAEVRTEFKLSRQDDEALLNDWRNRINERYLTWEQEARQGLPW